MIETPTEVLGERYLDHVETCKTCRPWSACAEGARILEQYTEAAALGMAPAPIERVQA